MNDSPPADVGAWTVVAVEPDPPHPVSAAASTIAALSTRRSKVSVLRAP